MFVYLNAFIHIHNIEIEKETKIFERLFTLDNPYLASMSIVIYYFSIIE